MADVLAERLSEFDVDDLTVRLVKTILIAVPGAPGLPPYPSLAQVAELMAVDADTAARAEALASTEDVTDILWLSRLVDTGDKGYAIFTGVTSALKLFFGGDDDDDDDATADDAATSSATMTPAALEASLAHDNLAEAEPGPWDQLPARPGRGRGRGRGRGGGGRGGGGRGRGRGGPGRGGRGRGGQGRGRGGVKQRMQRLMRLRHLQRQGQLDADGGARLQRLEQWAQSNGFPVQARGPGGEMPWRGQAAPAAVAQQVGVTQPAAVASAAPSTGRRVLDALETDKQQRNDAVLKGLALAWLAWKATDGTLQERANAFISMPAGQALLVYYAAAEIALPFADNLVSGGGSLVSRLFSGGTDEQLSRLSTMAGGRDLGEAAGMLAMLTEPLGKVVDAVAPHVETIADGAACFIPGAMDVADRAAGVVANAADVMPVYRLLGSRLAAEVAVAQARQG